MTKNNSKPKKSSTIDLKKARIFITSYSTVIYLVFICTCIAVAMLLVFSLVNYKSNEAGLGNGLTSFDEETIKDLREDESKSQKRSFELPSGRINPFGS